MKTASVIEISLLFALAIGPACGTQSSPSAGGGMPGQSIAGSSAGGIVSTPSLAGAAGRSSPAGSGNVNAGGTPEAGGQGGIAGTSGSSANDVAGGGSGAGSGRCADVAESEPWSKSIAGSWEFTPASGTKRSIQVPGGGWLKQGINAASGTYATQITVPDSGRPQTTLIEFGAVNYQATLSVDGKQVATNTTSFTPSVFDVTQFVTPGKQHAISVQVNGGQALKANGKSIVPNAAGWSSNVAQGIFRSAVFEEKDELFPLQ